MPTGRTDSDLDDVWSDESGEVDRAELTEFDFNPPKPKEALKRRAPLTSDLEAPVLGALPETVPPPPSKGQTLPIGAVLEGASASLLTDVRSEKREAREPENRTMIGDAESAAIAHAVSRSVQTGAHAKVIVPPVLEREDVHKVLMGKPLEEASSPPSAAGALEFEADDDPPTEPPADPPLELAYDPRTPSPGTHVPSAIRHAPARRSSFSMKWIMVALAVVVFIAVCVRLFMHA